MARGGSVIDPVVVEGILADLAAAALLSARALTPRERDVLAQIAQGRSNAAVGETLFLSEKSVEKHISVVFAKLGLEATPEVNRRVLAVLLYLSEQEG